MYRVENVEFSLGNKKIINGISFEIGRKEIFTIIGPNGSGKTTLFKLLTGVYNPTGGTIYLQDRDIKKLSAAFLSKKFAVVSQNINIQFPFTCFEVVMMGRNPHMNGNGKISDRDVEAVYSAMEKTDTVSFADRYITELSGGEKQRIMLARAIAQGTGYIFLDEAFSEMDMHYAVKSMKLLRMLVDEEKITVVNIVHDLNMAYHFSDRILMLKDGCINSIGVKGEVMKSEVLNKLFNIRVESIKDKGILVLPEV